MEDYRDLRGRYDRLVSVEMIEAVGWRHFDEYFRRCSELLSPDGLMLLQAITIDDRLYEAEKGARSFANTHVFPGGCLPSKRLIADCLARVTDMRQVWIDDITAHYPPTLASWRERFLDAWERLRAARLRRALPPPLGVLPLLLGGGLPRAPDRRRAAAPREAGVAVSEERREPLLLLHGLGGSKGSGRRCSACSRPSGSRWRSTCRASAPRRRSPPRSSRAPPTWPRRCTSAASSWGSSGPTSPATRSAAGSRWRWDGPAGRPR